MIVLFMRIQCSVLNKTYYSRFIHKIGLKFPEHFFSGLYKELFLCLFISQFFLKDFPPLMYLYPHRN